MLLHAQDTAAKPEEITDEAGSIQINLSSSSLCYLVAKTFKKFDSALCVLCVGCDVQVQVTVFSQLPPPRPRLLQ